MSFPGDGPEMMIVEYGKPPQNRKERLKVLRKMSAHSEYCSSGDSTLEAIHLAVNDVVTLISMKV